MEIEKFVIDTIMALTAQYAQRGVDITADKAKEIIDRFCQKQPSLKNQIGDVDELIKQIRSIKGQNVGRMTYNEETLSRFLEVPIADLPQTSPDNIDINALYDHVRLEGKFQEWLLEWGYKVEIGEPLIGLKGIVYIPDIYGELTTLHGKFEICVSLICDNPPDENRVLACLQKIEAYADNKKTFSYRDIFAIVTPHRFTKGAMDAMSLQNEQRGYWVVPIIGSDINTLECVSSFKERLSEFRDKIKLAEDETQRSKYKQEQAKPQDEHIEI